ncbi:MAG: DNA-binding protein [Deltaproteobacteria bacterium]|nr:DNA-binding protein [Deltaproteobacteria bacterium]
MIVSQFQETGHFIGRLDPEQDVIAALKTVCSENSVSCGWITASAVLINVEMRPILGNGSGFGEPLVLDGALFCPFINGNISLNKDIIEIRLYASALPCGEEEDKAVPVASGQILRGEVRFFEFNMLSVQDATLVRQDDDGFEQWQQLQTIADMNAANLSTRHPMGPLNRPKPTPVYQSADDDEASELVIIEMKAGDLVRCLQDRACPHRRQAVHSPPHGKARGPPPGCNAGPARQAERGAQGLPGGSKKESLKPLATFSFWPSRNP